MADDDFQTKLVQMADNQFSQKYGTLKRISCSFSASVEMKKKGSLKKRKTTR